VLLGLDAVAWQHAWLPSCQHLNTNNNCIDKPSPLTGALCAQLLLRGGGCAWQRHLQELQLLQVTHPAAPSYLAHTPSFYITYYVQSLCGSCTVLRVPAHLLLGAQALQHQDCVSLHACHYCRDAPTSACAKSDAKACDEVQCPAADSSCQQQLGVGSQRHIHLTTSLQLVRAKHAPAACPAC
jgi:hypothetical protein